MLPSVSLSHRRRPPRWFQPTDRSVPSCTATIGVPSGANRSMPWWKPVSARGAPQSLEKLAPPATGKTYPAPSSVARTPGSIGGFIVKPPGGGDSVSSDGPGVLGGSPSGAKLGRTVAGLACAVVVCDGVWSIGVDGPPRELVG